MPETRVAELFAELGADTSPLERSLSRAEQSMQRTSQVWANAARQMETRSALLAQKYDELRKSTEAIENATKKAGLAFSAGAAAGGALLGSSTQLAARVETLGVVTTTLGRNVGYTEGQMRQLEQSVVDQGITLSKSREAIALMIQANLDLAQATKLARLAQDAAVIAGENSSETFQKLIYVISSGNILMARRMGLLVDFEGAYQREAKALGVSTDALDENQRLQIRVNEVMAKGVNIAGTYEAAMTTAGKKVASLDRHIEESRRILGEVWLPVYASAVDAVTASLQKWEDLDEDQQAATSSILGYATAIAGAEGVTLLTISAVIKATTAFRGLAAAIGVANVAALGLGIGIPVAIIAGVATLSAKTRAEIKAQGDTIAQSAKQVDFAKTSYKEYSDALDEAAEAANLVFDAEGNLIKVRLGDRRGRRELIAANVKISETTYEAARANLQLANDIAIANAELERRAVLEKAQQGIDFQQQLDDLSLMVQDPFGELRESFEETQASLIEDAAKLRDAITDLEGKPLTDRGRAELQELQRELGNTKLAILENARAYEEETRVALFGILQQRIAQMELTADQQQAAFTMLNNVGHAWGIIGDATFQALTAIDQQLGEFSQGNVKAAQREIIKIGLAAQAIEGDYHIRFHVTVDMARENPELLKHQRFAEQQAKSAVQSVDDLINQTFPGGTFGGLKGTGGLVAKTPKLKEEKKKSPLEIALETANALSSIGNIAADIIREQTIEPLKKQIALIDELMQPDHLDMTARERSADLEKQRAEAAEKVVKAEQQILELKKRQQQIRLLEQQMRLIELAKEHKLNLKDLLGGVKLGIDADMNAVLGAVVKAMDEIIAKTKDKLEIGSPSKLGIRFGKWYDQGIAQGLMAGIPDVKRANEQMLGMILPGGALVGPSIDDRQSTQSGIREGDVNIYVSADILSDRSKVRDLARMLGEEYKRNR